MATLTGFEPVLQKRRLLELRFTSWLNTLKRCWKRGFDLISDALPFGRLCYGEPNAIANAIGYRKFARRS
jgi:hypothetical protein